MKHGKLQRKALEAAAIVSKMKNAPGYPLKEGIRKTEDNVVSVVEKFSRKHKHNMRAVWTELTNYLEKHGKTKTLKALREAANRMSALSTKEAISVLEEMGIEIRKNSDVVVIVVIGNENVPISLPNVHGNGDSKLKNRDYATRIVCAALGNRGSEALDYLQPRIGNKATRGLFRKAKNELEGLPIVSESL